MEKWEEKNYTEQEKNYLNNNERGEIDITISTPKKSKIKECKNTGWTRNCPKCNKVIFYTTKYSRNQMVRRKSACKTCVDVDKKSTQVECTRGCPKCKKVLLYKKKWARNDAEKRKLLCKSCAQQKHRSLTRECPKCKTIIHYKDGSKLNRANKQRRVCNGCRKKRIVEVMSEKSKKCGNRSFYPNYNQKACEYFAWLNMWLGWNGQYATYRGEKNILNYFVDYYEPTINIVIEWDESHHNRKSQIIKDRHRQEEIKMITGCKFYRYNELTSTIREV